MRVKCLAQGNKGGFDGTRTLTSTLRVWRATHTPPYDSLSQSSHFGTLNNLGKYIYVAFALRNQLTNDNWTNATSYCYININISVSLCSIQCSVTLCVFYCKMYCVRWWTVMFKSEIKSINISICYLATGYLIANHVHTSNPHRRFHLNVVE